MDAARPKILVPGTRYQVSISIHVPEPGIIPVLPVPVPGTIPGQVGTGYWYRYLVPVPGISMAMVLYTVPGYM